MQNHQDYWYRSHDNLKLYARDYQHSSPLATIVCIPGLTRNSADFEELAEHLNNRFRVIAVELRGRGKSEYDSNPGNYHPGIYIKDIVALLDSLALESVILIGTSLGGLVSMMLAAHQPERVLALVMNDIGPEADQEGLAKIAEYVCNPLPVATWEDAVDNTRAIHGSRFPNYSDDDWLRFTQKLFRENDQGQPELNYDPAIGILLQQGNSIPQPTDLWPVFLSITNLPFLVLRGELSDVLSRQNLEKMLELKQDIEFAEISDCGHAPSLTEPQSLSTLDNFLNAKFSADSAETSAYP